MRVIAKFAGFYGGARRRIGDEFDMSDKDVKLDAKGEILAPRWVVKATPESKRELANAQKVQEERDIKAATAAAGPKRPGREAVKADDLV